MGQPSSEYKKDFIARTKQARKGARVTQKQMGHALGGMAQDVYKNFETKRMLPREQIPTFCFICGITADWLFDVERGDGQLNDTVEPRADRKPPARPIRRVSAKAG